MTLTNDALVLQETRMSRQTMLLPAAIAEMNVLIVGTGSIGSNAAHLFVSMGIHNITLVDNDTVTHENIFPSWFYPSNVGLKKVDALYQQMEEYGVLPVIVDADVNDVELQDYYDVILVATDSIESRAAAFQKMMHGCAWWLDARMGGDSCTLYSIDTTDPKAMDAYRKLELRPVTSELLCGEKATAYNTKGSLMQFIGWAVRDIAVGERKPPYQLIAGGTNEMVVDSRNPPILKGDP